MARFSCVGVSSVEELHLVDSLNTEAYNQRYKDLELSSSAALKAYQAADSYSRGKAEACNSLGFCTFMRMDFERAERYYKEVYSLTGNEVEMLIADVGLMKIYQRTALNKEFYDYRNSALQRMKRLAEDTGQESDSHERSRLAYARSEFHIVSAVYYYYLQQRQQALEAMDSLAGEEEWTADTGQWLYYHYIKGSAALCEGATADVRRMAEFDELFRTWKRASQEGYLYFEGNAIQGLANLMASPDAYAFFLQCRPHALQQLGFPTDSLLPLRLGQQALLLFRRYNDLYQIAGAYVSIGRYLNTHGRYEEALDTLVQALECVNEHHRYYYNCTDSLDWLKPYDVRDTVSVEKLWMKQKLKTVPEWISRIREQLCVSYSGLGMKPCSDYNRNVYLDILEDTRQDKELESRYQALEGEANRLNVVLIVLAVVIISLILFLSLFSKRAKERNARHTCRLQLLLNVCGRITASIPQDAQDEANILEVIREDVAPEVNELFGREDWYLAEDGLYFRGRTTKEEQAIARVISPYVTWALDNGMRSVSLGNEQRRLEKQRYVYEQHIIENKRQNMVKKSCLAIVDGILPYIDRIVNEVHKLTRKEFLEDEEIKNSKLHYIDELVTKINEYNDILAHWIKMKQGTLSLNIETFELNELFELLRKGGRAFEMKGQNLLILPTEALVKADKALTLFMVNTLAENARKFTPRGGEIKVYARCEADYVEISVEDNGCGLSSEDVSRLMGEKIYDSSTIGMDHAENPDELRKSKGDGFGLMNCKGIIEKYRKSNPLFQVCMFSVESTLGQGSRFYFRLPAGVRKALLAVGLLFTLFSCVDVPETSYEEMPEGEPDAYAVLLDEASDYANAAYYCNIDGDYRLALQYVDSAMNCLNEHYRVYATLPHQFLSLWNEEQPVEFSWWNEGLETDYFVILDIRNEAAVAFLALKEWEKYAYNNTAYTTLYKMLGEDNSLEEYCRKLEISTTNKMVGMVLSVILLFAGVLAYYVVYVYRRQMERWNLEQVLEVNKQLSLAAAFPHDSEVGEEWYRDVLQRIVKATFDGVNELMGIGSLGIVLYPEGGGVPEVVVEGMSRKAEEMKVWRILADRCHQSGERQLEQTYRAFPLMIEENDGSRCIGVICVECTEEREQSADHLLLELIAGYLAIVLYNAVLKMALHYQDIEEAQDEARRASREDRMLHVQNLVLDNCLSAIKHETIYYPNRIKLLICKLCRKQLPSGQEQETLTAVGELIEYYKGIFSILSHCASRQLEEVTFRRSVIDVRELLDGAERYCCRKAGKSRTAAPALQQGMEPMLTVVGDKVLLQYLLENLIDEALACPLPGMLSLKAVSDGDFVRFLFTDSRRQKSQEELNQLFYPSLTQLETAYGCGLKGIEYLLCKQIIRDHDEFAGRRGCRINAEVASEGGFTVYFTLPKK
ncbi:MAG: DUF5113 domain-containing protein [Bacteroides sp.]|nr:DUF5113 domain-containing protein [Bacteroides sp.]